MTLHITYPWWQVALMLIVGGFGWGVGDVLGKDLTAWMQRKR